MARFKSTSSSKLSESLIQATTASSARGGKLLCWTKTERKLYGILSLQDVFLAYLPPQPWDTGNTKPPHWIAKHLSLRNFRKSSPVVHCTILQCSQYPFLLPPAQLNWTKATWAPSQLWGLSATYNCTLRNILSLFAWLFRQSKNYMTRRKHSPHYWNRIHMDKT